MPRGRAPYLERFIHGALYEARPDVMSVVHNHSESVIPFGVTGREDQADLPHGRIDRSRGAGLGFPRPFRRYRAAGREHGDGPRPRQAHRRRRHRADARPWRNRRGQEHPPRRLYFGLSRGQRAAAEAGHGHGRGQVPDRGRGRQGSRRAPAPMASTGPGRTGAGGPAGRSRRSRIEADRYHAIRSGWFPAPAT